jgi:hypothetical protein
MEQHFNLELEQLFDQIALEPIASFLGVNSGVCGYISYILARHLSTLSPPRNRNELQAFTQRLAEMSISLHTSSLPSVVSSVRIRRELYVNSHPTEFVAEGVSYEESLDANGRSRSSTSYFYHGILSIIDMQYLLQGKTNEGTNELQRTIPLLRSCQQLYPYASGKIETIDDVISSMSLSEDRSAVSEEAPFSDLSSLLGRLVGAASHSSSSHEPAVVTSILSKDSNVSTVTVNNPHTNGVTRTVESSSLLNVFIRNDSCHSVLEDYTNLHPVLHSDLCLPVVVETVGHYDVALPLLLEDEGYILLVLESMSNPIRIQHELLAAAFSFKKQGVPREKAPL